MGQSIGAAIGAQLAHPGRVIAAICGDGCFAMNAFEIATAAAERLPIRVFVFNDERLGMVERGHQGVYGRRLEYPTAPLDVCTVARGLGATALRVEGLGQLDAARDILRMTRGPVVVDVRIDPDIAIPGRDRVAAMARGARGAARPLTRNERHERDHGAEHLCDLALHRGADRRGRRLSRTATA
jgi:acetolactate synthase-1/2/3 large subunit